MDTAVTAWGPARRLVPGLLTPAATAAVAAAGLRVSGLGVLDAIGFALVIAWAIAAAVLARAADRTAHWLIALGALAGAVALTGARIGEQQHAARVLATLAGPLVIAISFHFLLALPDGRLGRPGWRLVAALGYATAVGTGIGLAVAGEPFPLMAGGLIWLLAVLTALPVTRLRYLKAAGRDQERMQWLGTGMLVAATVALISAVLHLLVGWPESAGAVAASASAVVPLAVVLGEWPPLARHGGSVLVHALSAAGSAAVVAVVYLVIVLGLGEAPGDNADRRLLGFSIVAAALAVIGYLPVRGRLAAFATRFVYGTREAPGESLRTFGSRMTRAVSMDELLLQLAESLRKTMRLDCAEIYTGAGDVLERTVSVPDAGRKSIVLTDRERPVVARAGVSGSAWASVWLPALLDGREQAQLRVAPISHAGELLGLIVVERARPRGHLHRRGRPRADRTGPPGRPGLPQLPARLRAADHAGRAAQAGGRAARIAGPHRRQRGRRTPPGRTRPARRGPAAPGGAGHQPPAGPRHRGRRPGRGRGDARPAGRRRAADHQGAARAGPRHLPAAAGRQRPRRRAAPRPRAGTRSRSW